MTDTLTSAVKDALSANMLAGRTSWYEIGGLLCLLAESGDDQDHQLIISLMTSMDLNLATCAARAAALLNTNPQILERLAIRRRTDAPELAETILESMACIAGGLDALGEMARKPHCHDERNPFQGFAMELLGKKAETIGRLRPFLFTSSEEALHVLRGLASNQLLEASEYCEAVVGACNSIAHEGNSLHVQEMLATIASLGRAPPRRLALPLSDCLRLRLHEEDLAMIRRLIGSIAL
jgi:hypothetical protein